MPRKRNNQQIPVTESLRIAVECTIRKFLNSDEAEWEYPNCYTSVERAYIHREASRHGLKSKSRGSGFARYVTIYKREGSAIVQKDASLSLTPAARNLLISLLNKQPVTTRERQDCTPPHDRSKDTFAENREGFRGVGRLAANVPLLPRTTPNQAYIQSRSALPIYNMRETIIKTIGDNQVTIISGPTGSGKSTQVPQYLAEWHESVNRACRIVVTQPRRIAAVTVSERIALERGEKLGHSVGYQVRFECKMSPYTVVTLCTVGVLLRSLMSGEQVLSSVSHVIIDEVHERDRHTDFILLVLREALSKHRSLRLVLMSATANTHQLSSYFNNCPVISVGKNSFDVKEYYLDDVLKMSSYFNSDMDRMRKNYVKRKSQAAVLEKWKNAASNPETDLQAVGLNPNLCNNLNISPTGVHKEMDDVLKEAWLKVGNDLNEKILNLIKNEVSIDYQHSETGLTALMVGAVTGNIDLCEQLLQLGASLTIRAANNYTALDFANEFKQPSTALLIKQQLFVEEHVEAPNEEDSEIIEMYYSMYGYEMIDTRLIVSLISNIHSDANRGSILVFLPGYEDIMSTKEALMQEEKKLNSKGCKIMVLMLHSRMHTADQRIVFKPALPGCRKIILSTNIAETSVTIDDVIFVIDCGKVKEKMYNALTGVSQLSTVWVSKSCAEQRKGRAGRTQPGVCYRLYSATRFKVFIPNPIPEILHTPIPDLCLFAKLLAPPNTSIVDFLSKALDPPSSVITRTAVSFLKTIDALDTWEDLTDLGHYLVEIPVDPKYGKMLIYASLLKCLDPILTIVCCLSYREFFTLPPTREKKAICEERIKFSAGSLSDHMTLLRVFQGWQESKRQGRERQFCREHYISGATMELILSTRIQVLAHLRASGFIRNKGPGDVKSANINSDNWAVVKAAIVGGLYPNIARLDRDHCALRTQKAANVGVEGESVLHENSSLQNLPTDWVVYEEMTRSGKLSKIRTATVVSPITIAIFAGPSKIPFDAFSDSQLIGDSSDSESGEEEFEMDKTAQFKLDDWMTFKMDSESAQLVLQLRIKWHALLLKKLKSVNKLLTPVEDILINTTVRVLSSEEQAVKLKQPVGVGRRPYLYNSDFRQN